MNGFYQITERLYQLFKQQGFRSITLDEEQELDLKRQSIYPLAHIVPIAGNWTDKTDSFGFLLIVLDLTDWNKDDPKEDNLFFYGADNRQDILHELHQKLRTVVNSFIKGDSFSDNMRITTPILPDPIIIDFENVLTGWSVAVNIEVPETAGIC